MAINLANNNSLANITALPSSISGGAMTLLATQTASGSANLSFTSGIDDTYDSYVFKFYNIHPATDNTQFAFQGDTGTNTNYNQTITSTTFRAFNREPNDDSGLGYVTGEDQAQGTAFQKLTAGGTVGADADQNACGELQIFNPSSTTFVKHFIGRSSGNHASDYATDFYVAGYFNLTTALTRFQFKMLSGNIDNGVIKLYGVS
jgi:hypothetical protein